MPTSDPQELRPIPTRARATLPHRTTDNFTSSPAFLKFQQGRELRLIDQHLVFEFPQNVVALQSRTWTPDHPRPPSSMRNPTPSGTSGTWARMLSSRLATTNPTQGIEPATHGRSWQNRQDQRFLSRLLIGGQRQNKKRHEEPRKNRSHSDIFKKRLPASAPAHHADERPGLLDRTAHHESALR